jgi:acyl CoA:acetate/3-ketoacid CoA transferase beta subunit
MNGLGGAAAIVSTGEALYWVNCTHTRRRAADRSEPEVKRVLKVAGVYCRVSC